MLKPLPIGAGSNLDVDQTTAHDGAATAYYNCYLDRAAGIHRFPGLKPQADVLTGVGANTYNYYSKTFDIRLIVSAGRMWVQHSIGGALVEASGGSLSIGVRPTFAEDNANIFVAANSSIYKLTGTTLTALGGNSPTNVTSLLYHGGFLLANGPEIAGDTTYSDDKTNGYALWEVYNNESKPDRLQALVLVDSQYIYNIGPESCEVTYFGGNPTNPFEVNRGRFSNFGTIAKYSPVYDGESLYYLSEVTQSRKVIKNAGGSATVISFPFDIPLEDFARVDDAEGFIMAFRGQNFYCLRFPNAAVVINEQFMQEVTFAYHIQKQDWIILSRWDAEQGEWKGYRGGDFVYVEPWGLNLIGDSNSGMTYTMYDESGIDYTKAPAMHHRWRDDNSKDWKNPRTISLGTAGNYKRPADQTQCGMYVNRQHEISYTDMTDNGEMFRMAIVSGNISHQLDVTKRSNYYRYNVKRGTNEFIINTISEDVTPLRR